MPAASAGGAAWLSRRLWMASLAAVLILAGCGASGPPEGARDQPRGGRAGLSLSGSVGGRQVAVSDGAAELLVADCDPGDGRDSDVCFVGSDIGGQLVVVVLENPDVLVTGEPIPIGDPACPTPPDCDDVEDVAIVDVQLGVGGRQRATGGELQLSELQPFLRYAGDLRLELPDGRLSGHFDVVPSDD